ncbi:toxin co-regulated pilus biosynthesis Q family protein [Chromobacterium vaccinii]|uniref:toxin co-regulated pilus biosynthesis Q family protein n=1 Tax=Chromobacterium vaccinii TaxID=1108595 RepID=UPI001E45EB6A|nr:toxin co-regulated pilus biosynthesis Q family protein [Chromobacterium vaccinii]MCD4500494.1 toxin co-regulated pilus biosynthesis Q family protein [Chromobacterium vaccinii]
MRVNAIFFALCLAGGSLSPVGATALSLDDSSARSPQGERHDVLAAVSAAEAFGLAQTASVAGKPKASPKSSAKSVSAVKPAWRIQPAVELREQLDAWAARAGWTLVWESEYAYLPKLQARFDGDFITAVTALFSALQDVNPPLYPVLYQGNQVLVVKSQPQR